MNETQAALKNIAKNALLELATQAYGLAMGLQNSAPPQDGSKPSPSVQYLLETALQMKEAAHSLDDSGSSTPPS